MNKRNIMHDTIRFVSGERVGENVKQWPSGCKWVPNHYRNMSCPIGHCDRDISINIRVEERTISV